MAMYENRGYCPSNDFLHYGSKKDKVVSRFWEKTKNILGDRIGYMVYSEAGNSYKDGPYIVDALEGAQDTLGIEVATVLKQLIPVCEYATFGCPIVCTDVINPYQIPVNIFQADGKWSLSVGENPTKTVLIEDERYLVAIQDIRDEEIRIYLYKK